METVKKVAKYLVKQGYKCAEEKSKFRVYEPKAIKKSKKI